MDQDRQKDEETIADRKGSRREAIHMKGKVGER
jgi:hypothetical protein